MLDLYSVLGLFALFLVAVLAAQVISATWNVVRRWVGLGCDYYDIDSFTLIHTMPKPAKKE